MSFPSAECRENTAKGVLTCMGMWLDARIDAFSEHDGELSTAVSLLSYKNARLTLEEMIRSAGLDPDEILIKRSGEHGQAHRTDRPRGDHQA